MSRRTKKRSGFRKGLTIYVIILLVIFLAALALLWRFLDGYQARQDAAAAEVQAAVEQSEHEKEVYRAPQLAFEDFLSSMTADYWTDQWFAAHPESLDKRDAVGVFMDGLFFGPDFSAWKAESFTQEHPVYVLKNGDRSLATVALAGSELNWSVSDVTLLLQGTESASLEVPEDCTVYCNGAALDSALYSKGETGYFDMEDYADSLTDPVLYTTYTVTDQLFEPALTVEAPADRTLVQDESGHYSYVLSSQEAEPFQQRGKEFLTALVHFYMMGASNTYGNMYTAAGYVHTNSQAYNMIINAGEGVTWDTPYPGYTSTITADSQVTRWAANCVSVDVSYHAEGTAGAYTNVADGTYRIYFFDMGEGYEIYGLAKLG